MCFIAYISALIPPVPLKIKSIQFALILVGLISVTISVFYGNDKTSFIKPFFHFLLYSFYWVSVKKHNFLLVLFLISAMIGEFLVSKNFVIHYSWIVILFFFVFVFGTLLLVPVLKFTKAKLHEKDYLNRIVGIIGFLAILACLYVLTIDFLPGLTFYIFAFAAFSIFLVSCFYINVFHKHPKNIYLFFVAVGYLMVCFGAVVYEFLWSSWYLLLWVNLCEVLTQFCFVYYLIHLDEVLTRRKWFI